MEKRKIALYDIDKTSYEGLLIKDFVRYQVSTGTLTQETFDRIENEEKLYKKGKPYEDMAQDMLVHWAGDLKDKKVSDVEREVNMFFKTPDGDKFLPFVRESINLLKPTHDTYFITAEPQFVAKEVSTVNLATEAVSTIFGTKAGLFTGEIISSLAKREDKGREVRQLMQTHQYERSFAFGDSDGDIEMLESVEYPICVNPNDKLLKTRDERGWKNIKNSEIVIFIKDVIKSTANS